jgi:hypothetical protein
MTLFAALAGVVGAASGVQLILIVGLLGGDDLDLARAFSAPRG